jgi:photosystem II stability/assembly factor-like uncharacterized protein
MEGVQVQRNHGRGNPPIQTVLAVVFAGITLFLSLFSFPDPVEAQQGLRDDLFFVHFINDTEGWTCGRWGAILHTGDGGKTWERQKSGTDNTLSAIYFVDAQKGWAVGDVGTIIHTSDGGKTWERQKSPVDFFHMGVCFVTPEKGWVVSERTHILYTSDGGKTWSVQFKDEDYILKGVSFADELHGWAVGEYGYIYATQDGGINWQRQAGYFEISLETGNPEGGNFLFAVEAVDPNTVWAAGIDGYVIKTEDGGKTWKEIKTGAEKTQLFGIATDGKGNIVIGGEGVFLSSSDNGATWEFPAFDPPLTYGWIYGVDNRGASGFVAVGWEGAIYLNASGTWKRVNY